MSALPPAEQCEHGYPHIAHKVWHHRDPADGPRQTRCPGVKIPAGSRVFRPGVRRAILDDLRSISKRVGWMVLDWSVSSTVFTSRGTAERPRRIGEYPENSAAAWAELHGDLDETIALLTELRERVHTAGRIAARREAGL